MILAVTFTATYPKTAPLLSIKGDGGLRDSTKFKIQKVIETKPKELVAEEQAMIMEIVNACQDILEDAAQAKAAGLELPSMYIVPVDPRLRYLADWRNLITLSYSI